MKELENVFISTSPNRMPTSRGARPSGDVRARSRWHRPGGSPVCGRPNAAGANCDGRGLRWAVVAEPDKPRLSPTTSQNRCGFDGRGGSGQCVLAAACLRWDNNLGLTDVGQRSFPVRSGWERCDVRNDADLGIGSVCWHGSPLRGSNSSNRSLPEPDQRQAGPRLCDEPRRRRRCP
jgi:hypothetical protein